VARHGLLHFRAPRILYDTYVKYGSGGKCWRKFRCKFHEESVPSRQTIHNLVNKLRTTGLLIDKKTKHKLEMLNEEKFDGIGAKLEHTSRESLKCLAQETECQSVVQEWQHNC
jgi:transposase